MNKPKYEQEIDLWKTMANEEHKTKIGVLSRDFRNIKMADREHKQR